MHVCVSVTCDEVNCACQDNGCQNKRVVEYLTNLTIDIFAHAPQCYNILAGAVLGIVVDCLAYEESILTEPNEKIYLIHDFCDAECWAAIQQDL